MTRLPRSFYARPAAEVAPDLLGVTLCRTTGGNTLKGRIVETEAYEGQLDPGSHAFRGPTPRTQVMFGPAGYAYVYISYGMHRCLNVVTDREGIAGAVLIRALQPLAGIDIMRHSRRVEREIDLCNGPGKLCQAFAITLGENGVDLEGDRLWLEDGNRSGIEIAVSTRVGLSRGVERPLRFFVSGSAFVSRGKPSAAESRPRGRRTHL